MCALVKSSMHYDVTLFGEMMSDDVTLFGEMTSDVRISVVNKCLIYLKTFCAKSCVL
jgi:hypothetical protein